MTNQMSNNFPIELITENIFVFRYPSTLIMNGIQTIYVKIR